jgi:hypothetical protein
VGNLLHLQHTASQEHARSSPHAIPLRMDKVLSDCLLLLNLSHLHTYNTSYLNLMGGFSYVPFIPVDEA